MLLAVVLQIIGCALVVAAAYLWLGLPLALVVAGSVTFAAGFDRERNA